MEMPFASIDRVVHYDDVIMGAMASQITSITIVYSTAYSDVDQRKHQSSASLAFVRGIHREPVNSPHKWPVTRKLFPFHDVIMLEAIELILIEPLFLWVKLLVHAVEVTAWMSNCIPSFNADVITYPCRNHHWHPKLIANRGPWCCQRCFHRWRQRWQRLVFST